MTEKGRVVVAPFLVTLGFDEATFTRLEELRRRYFPPERNVVPAHLSLFHKLPPEEEPTLREILSAMAARTPPLRLTFARLRRLGGGMAVEVEAEGLGSLQASLARSFDAWLTPQDRQPFRPHVTVMNKAPPEEAARAFAELGARWAPWHGQGEALLLWRYLGGPWEEVGRFPLARHGESA
jgi:2'-5' RNA ligase